MEFEALHFSKVKFLGTSINGYYVPTTAYFESRIGNNCQLHPKDQQSINFL
jgi:hypothetical protein